MMGTPTEGYYIRDKNWFLKWNVTKDHIQLFDMKTDQNNDYDLSEVEPEIVKSMSEKIEKWKNERMLY